MTTMVRSLAWVLLGLPLGGLACGGEDTVDAPPTGGAGMGANSGAGQAGMATAGKAGASAAGKSGSSPAGQGGASGQGGRLPAQGRGAPRRSWRPLGALPYRDGRDPHRLSRCVDGDRG